jgi:hypothetical protein
MEDGDPSKGAKAAVNAENPFQREQNSDPIGKHIRTSSNSPPDSAASESRDKLRKPHLWTSDVLNAFVPLRNHEKGVSSWSASSGKQLGSPGSATDRVFPIRSVVSVDSSQTPNTLSGRNSSEQQDYFPPAAGYGNAAGHQSRQSFSEANGKLTPQTQQPSRYSGERTRGERKKSTPIAHSDSDRYGGGLRMQLFSDATSEKSKESHSVSAQSTMNAASLGTQTPAEQMNISGLVTARFKHIVTAEGHAVITGRDGETLQRCEDEP